MRINNKTGIKNNIRTGLIRGLSVVLALSAASCSLTPASLIPGQGQNNAVPQAQELLIPVTRGSIASELSFVGNLQYNQSAEMTWKTAGVIDKVHVQLGDQVKKGDILAELAADSLNASVILAEKTMIEQQEKLEDVKDSASNKMQAYVTLNQKEKALIQAKLDQEALYYPRATREEMERAWDSFALANLNFNYAKQDYDYLVSINEPWEGFEEPREIRFGRMSIITGGDSRSGRERKFEDYVSTYNTLVSAYEKYVWTSGQPSATDYAVAEGNVEVAQMEYDKALEEYRSYEILPREKDLNAAEAGLRTAETNYNQRFILAQFDGTVTSLTAVEGYYVTRGSAALRLDDKSRIFIPISIPELDISSVRNGTEVSLTLDAVSGKTYSGHLYTIADASAVSGSTTAFSAMVEVDDPDEKMLAGMTAEITMKTGEKSDVLLIPNSAVTYADGKTTVTVVNGTEHQQLEITLGATSGSISEVTSGNLRQDAQLVVSSISEEALTQLGLDPASYLNIGPTQRQFPASIQMPEGSASGRESLPEMRPEKTAIPAENPQQAPESGTEQKVTAEADAAEPEASPTAAAAQTGTAEPTAAADSAVPAAEETTAARDDQPAFMGEGEFPNPPGGGQFPSGGDTGSFPVPPAGQRPEGDAFQGAPGGMRPNGEGNSQFQGPPGGQRPERGGDGGAQRQNMTTATPDAESGSREKG